jgi:hypothetical protein
VLKPARMSVTPAASQTREPPGKPTADGSMSTFTVTALALSQSGLPWKYHHSGASASDHTRSSYTRSELDDKEPGAFAA